MIRNMNKAMPMYHAGRPHELWKLKLLTSPTLMQTNASMREIMIKRSQTSHSKPKYLLFSKSFSIVPFLSSACPLKAPADKAKPAQTCHFPINTIELPHLAGLVEGVWVVYYANAFNQIDVKP